MTTWRWVAESVVLAIHDEQLAEHGGATGVRDIALLQSALARPPHLAAYGKPDIADLAASYASGIVRDHPFVDGNKRTAMVVANVFLLDNGFDISVDDQNVVVAMTALADGTLNEGEFALWLRELMVPDR